MNATSAGPTESPSGPAFDGSPSATVVRAPVAGSIFEMRPVSPLCDSCPSMVTTVSPPLPASAT